MIVAHTLPARALTDVSRRTCAALNSPSLSCATRSTQFHIDSSIGEGSTKGKSWSRYFQEGKKLERTC
eukprot:4337287-Amphidinium_carterae.1